MDRRINKKDLKAFLDDQVAVFNRPGFIRSDPISVPHQFSLRQDIEIAGFFAALLAWGNRTAIVNSCDRLFTLMDRAPYDFILHFEPADLKPFLSFVHRTFNATDLLYLLHFLQQHYRKYQSLESAFAQFINKKSTSMAPALAGFHDYCFSLPEAPQRTRKHIATPVRGSACKRLNMYLRWMVRQDDRGVDFGLWTDLSPALLLCPLDVHVARVARKLGLLDRRQNDWKATQELTEVLRKFAPADPVKYDFALFGLGISGVF